MNRTIKLKCPWLARLTGCFAALCLSLAFLGGGAATPAQADGFISFGFGTSFGHGHRHHRYGHYRHGHRYYYGRRYHKHRYYRHRHYGHHHHRHSHVTYTKVIPAKPAQQASRPAARKEPEHACLMIREYQTKITVGGQEVDAYGDACLQPDGSWRLGAPKQVPAG